MFEATIIQSDIKEDIIKWRWIKLDFYDLLKCNDQPRESSVYLQSKKLDRSQDGRAGTVATEISIP